MLPPPGALPITGMDGLSYTQVQIPGSYHGHDGVFEYIYDVNKKCNHRFFRIQWKAKNDLQKMGYGV